MEAAQKPRSPCVAERKHRARAFVECSERSACRRIKRRDRGSKEEREKPPDKEKSREVSGGPEQWGSHAPSM